MKLCPLNVAKATGGVARREAGHNGRRMAAYRVKWARIENRGISNE
jgi:hypothetical protein